MASPLVAPAGPVEAARPPSAPRTPGRQLLRWAIVLGSALLVLAAPVPAGIEASSWRLLAIFVATMLGLIVQPLPGGAMVLLGVAATAVFGVLTLPQALAGYADSLVWLVLSAFMIARGMIKSGLGRRIALIFVRFLGHTSLGLGYALSLTDGVLGSILPSNSARSGGIVFPLAQSISESYGSRPGPTAERLGAFLLPLVYQADVLVCALFLTGQASNLLIADFARQVTGTEVTYWSWFAGAAVPGIASLALVPLVIYRFFPPLVKHTPGAAEYARKELSELGPVSRDELLMLATFLLILVLWLTAGRLHDIEYAVVALLGLGGLLVTGVLTWHDITTERQAWDVFVWYGGLIQLARMLGETGITEWFAQSTAGYLTGMSWPVALTALVVVYYYAHYGFASITAHAGAMYIPFLAVAVAAGAPPVFAAMVLVYVSNLCASLTHYGTTPAPILFGAGYVTQGRWWRIGFVVSLAHLAIWGVLGSIWWKVLGWW